jgi:hypothetical protein
MRQRSSSRLHSPKPFHLFFNKTNVIHRTIPRFDPIFRPTPLHTCRCEGMDRLLCALAQENPNGSRQVKDVTVQRRKTSQKCGCQWIVSFSVPPPGEKNPIIRVTKINPTHTNGCQHTTSTVEGKHYILYSFNLVLFTTQVIS